jgi:hypothetical protein
MKNLAFGSAMSALLNLQFLVQMVAITGEIDSQLKKGLWNKKFCIKLNKVQANGSDIET